MRKLHRVLTILWADWADRSSSSAPEGVADFCQELHTAGSLAGAGTHKMASPPPGLLCPLITQ
jgi:hypothetical protein